MGEHIGNLLQANQQMMNMMMHMLGQIGSQGNSGGNGRFNKFENEKALKFETKIIKTTLINE